MTRVMSGWKLWNGRRVAVIAFVYQFGWFSELKDHVSHMIRYWGCRWLNLLVQFTEDTELDTPFKCVNTIAQLHRR